MADKIIMLPIMLFRPVLVLLLLCFTGATLARDLTPAQQIGQKVMLDLRYFCSEPSPSPCRTPFTRVTDANRAAITHLLTRSGVGGVILFSENIVDIPQLVTLNYTLQSIVKAAGLPPLFIGVDQEGGRVARLPDSMAERFAGNMALGATYASQGVKFARDVATGQASTLRLTGFNVNFAPSLDVNTNPDNPVINVRSYGESPQVVAQLGEATVRAMQTGGIISAVKHFPGHGDTHIDSHTGLPQVQHAADALRRNELFPFARVIRNAQPAMVMTAHIQFPALDSTTLTNKNGEVMTVPATMSKTLLQGVLRKDIGFTGLIVSDAMDMAGIANFFAPQQALIHAFRAGVDIALMPQKVTSADDIAAFDALLNEVAGTLSGKDDKAQISTSLTRINQVKRMFDAGQFVSQPLSARLSRATALLPQTSNRLLAEQVSRASVTAIKTSGQLPLSARKRWLILMPDSARCVAMVSALSAAGVSNTDCLAYHQIPAEPRWQLALMKSDYVIIGDISPQHAFYEMGGLDPVRPRASLSEQHQWLQQVAGRAAQTGQPVVFVAMRAPYSATMFMQEASDVLATYDYHVNPDNLSGETGNRVFRALAEVLTGKVKASGTLPVSVAGSAR
ncbi:glycoside hydrolase family 3 N-terminal domain-containing protein [Alteromonas sp. CYL-A6]|uniref:glycoside hydrolase family 3 N-terminal domain-containing protein n=1 Tax=Alteromonas nitratireducens TaxID=3390813 RepID=UPI0034A8B4CF